MRDGIKSTGAVALVTSGIATAFALAACCAIPFLLAGIGLSAGWLAPVVTATQPYATILTIVSLIALTASVAIVWWGPRHCRPGALCARRGFRWTITVAAVIGAALLILSKVYA